MSILSDIATLLATSGLGIYDPVGITSTVFTHELPPAPPSAIAVLVYGGAPPGPYNLDSTIPEWENPRIQITARDPDGDTALATANAAYKALVAVSDRALGGIHYFKIRALQQPFSLGRDHNNLFRYVFNCECQKVIS